jgi:hypothetical protein
LLRSFCVRYDLTYSQIEKCEAWLKTLPAKPLILSHPVLDRIVEVDMVGVEERETSY